MAILKQLTDTYASECDAVAKTADAKAEADMYPGRDFWVHEAKRWREQAKHWRGYAPPRTERCRGTGYIDIDRGPVSYPDVVACKGCCDCEPVEDDD